MIGWKSATDAVTGTGAIAAGGTLSIIKKTTLDTSKKSLFDQIIEKIIPPGLMKFIKSPIDYILKEWMGIDLTKKQKEMGGPTGPVMSASEIKKKKMESRDAMVESILGSMGWMMRKLPGAEGATKWALNKVFNMLGMAKGGTFSAGKPIIVGEMGPEMIMPSGGGQVFNAQRTQQMMQAGIQRDMGGGAGGGVTSINTGGNVVSAPTTNYVNNGIAARRPIILAA